MGPADGVWTYDYFQEGQDPSLRDDFATNRGLMACLADDVPVAVLIQEKAKPNVQYRVRGLAKVAGWEGGHFKLQGYDLAGNLTATPANDVETYASPTLRYGGFTESVPMDLYDARKRIETQIVVRQGGKAFRDKALKNFKGRCAISGWDVADVLEAAHIVPYRGLQTDQPDNALLLRADLHTLFDRQLLHIDPATFRIHLAPALQNSPYAAFSGQQVHPAEDVAPETFRERLLTRAEQLKPKTT